MSKAAGRETGIPGVAPSRRSLIGMGLGAGVLAACATTPRPAPGLTAQGILRPIKVSADRVTRVVVGLRPFRPAGFVVKAEPLGGKRLVHNYGHGGSGITLSWGTAQLAADLAGPVSGVRCAVIGAGVAGLTTARILQQRGAQVTIYAEALPPLTTSNIAGGHWWPTTVFDSDAADVAFRQQFHAATRLSYRYFQTQLGGPYGVSWRRSYTLYDERRDFGPFTRALEDVAPEMAVLAPGQHPFGQAWVQRYATMMIEPAVFLQAVLEDVLVAGGRVEVRRFREPAELAVLPETVVFNCTGLGARDLFGDQALTPVRGQLVVLLPQAELDYNLMAGPTYIFPRSDGVIIGGTFERGQWDTAADPAVTARILERAAQTAGRLQV